MSANSTEDLQETEASQKSSIPRMFDLISEQNNETTSTSTVMRSFTWDRFKSNPATVGLLRYARPELCRLERELSFLNMKCRTYYERFIYVSLLRKHADVVDSFDLTVGKTFGEMIESIPPLLRDSLLLYQLRWRNCISSTRWQEDFTKACKALITVQARLEKCRLELERRRSHLEMYKKILTAKEKFANLGDEEKLEKVESLLGIQAPSNRSKQNTPTSRRRSLSDGSLASISSPSEDDLSWDEMWSGVPFSLQEKEPDQSNTYQG
ncbi:unnamed protein product [Cylicocyclus nassatus]|uniref:Uncharacterized protein n=1 Tax=Cylicocyclus nassatus TaxID=53992 RepID=A0AA36GRG4_CYLNA|nr:unnamed protein product [Cylicocyclus nassatus]